MTENFEQMGFYQRANFLEKVSRKMGEFYKNGDTENFEAVRAEYRELKAKHLAIDKAEREERKRKEEELLKNNKSLISETYSIQSRAAQLIEEFKKFKELADSLEKYSIPSGGEPAADLSYRIAALELDMSKLNESYLDWQQSMSKWFPTTE